MDISMVYITRCLIEKQHVYSNKKKVVFLKFRKANAGFSKLKSILLGWTTEVMINLQH